MSATVDDRTELRDVATRYAADRVAIDDLRRLRVARAAAVDEIRARWREMAELGWAGLLVPEAHGGAGAGLEEMGVVLEALGGRLAVTPIIPTAIVLPALLAAGGTPAQREKLLPGVSAGTLCAALAIEETSRFSPSRVTTTAETAEAAGAGVRLTGVKRHVIGGPMADVLVVSAQEGDGLSLFLVDASTPGVEIVGGTLIDSQPVATVHLNGVEVSGEARLGSAGAGLGLLEPALDLASVAITAEMLGAAQQAFDLTVAFLKEREQFGVVIGAYQALQHRVARLYCDLEVARGVVERALAGPDGERARMVSAAKAMMGETGLRIAEEGIQLHGGIGMTDEADIGFYLKRARVAELLYGDAGYHRDRFGGLGGY